MKNPLDVQISNIIHHLILVLLPVLIITTNIPNVSSWKCSCGDYPANHSREESRAYNQSRPGLHLCNWEQRIHYDPKRIPTEIIYAKLIQKEHCGWPEKINRETTHCVPIEVNMNVTLNCNNGTCGACLENYPVAFICSCKPQLGYQGNGQGHVTRINSYATESKKEPCA